MKTELSKIVQDLEQGVISENEARTLLLSLLGVGGSTVVELSVGDKLLRTTEDVPPIGTPQTTKGIIYEVERLSVNERHITGESVGIRVDNGWLRWYAASKIPKNFKKVQV